jgi:uncharacterized membrane protein YdcZ (DUF606 family)
MAGLSKVFLKLAATAFLCSVTVFLVYVAVALATDPKHFPHSLGAIPRWLRMPGWVSVALVTSPVVLAAISVFLGILADIWRD